jgi:kinetochore protein NDC80
MSVAAMRPPPAQPVFGRPSSSNNETGAFSAGPRQSLFGQSASRKSYLPNATPARPSQPLFAPTPGGVNNSGMNNEFARRSSVFSANNRPSAAGPMGAGAFQTRESFFATAPLPAGVPTDPRRLRDASVRAQMASELMDYLTRNNFELETSIGLTGKTLTSPTQKEFASLFKWLYNRIDPAYRFQKNLDAEIPPLLKQLRYPFEKSITKSQIAAVGGNNWHTFLGLLHWIMGLAQMMDAFAVGRYDSASLAVGADLKGDRIIFEFLSDAYKAWLSVDNETTDEEAELAVQPYADRMAARFREINSDHVADVKMLEAEKESLVQQIARFEEAVQRGASLDGKLDLIKSDLAKFEDWITKSEQRTRKAADKIAVLEEEISKVDEEIAVAERERGEHQAALTRMGITIGDLDRMTAELDRLEKAKAAMSARLDEARQRCAEREAEAARKLDDLERTVDAYNAQAYRTGLIPSTAPNAKNQNFELKLKLSAQDSENADLLGSLDASVSDPAARLLISAASGPNRSILSLDVNNVVKSNILALRREIGERRNRALEEDMKNHSLLDKVMEAMDDKQAEVEGLGHRIRAAEDEHRKTKETSTTQRMQVDAQVEKLEGDIARMRAGQVESLQVLEQKEMDVSME